jgi:hypothetical protein
MSNRELTAARRWFPARLMTPAASSPPPWAAPMGVALGAIAVVGPTLPFLFLFARARFRAARARRAAARNGALLPTMAVSEGARAPAAAAALPQPPPPPAPPPLTPQRAPAAAAEEARLS